VRRELPLVTPLAETAWRSLAVTPADIDGLLARGVPFHLAVNKVQDIRPALRTVPKRLAAGETLYLVNAHEYMPRLRRFVYQLGRASGFAGRPFRTFLFRVDAPGRLVLGMHDDGDTELAWLQFAGERFTTFGSRGATGPKRSLRAANGNRAGWFEGGLAPGDLIYLPPYAPHNVHCRKPSIAVSVYWEPVNAAAAAGDWLLDIGAPDGRSFPPARAVAGMLRKGAAAAGGEAYARWLAGVATDDGAHDRPAAANRAPWAAKTRVSAWRAFEVLAQGRNAVLRAGGDLEIAFPKVAAPTLARLAHYGAGTVEKLQRAGGLPAGQLGVLLDALAAEGLIVAGELPLVGDFEPASLSGWDYSITDR
jgi:hypothetical protein